MSMLWFWLAAAIVSSLFVGAMKKQHEKNKAAAADSENDFVAVGIFLFGIVSMYCGVSFGAELWKVLHP